LGLIDALVVDEADADEDAGIPTIVTRTLMRDADARRRLAEAVLRTPGMTATPAKPARPTRSASQASAL
jgi:hypothetical protein